MPDYRRNFLREVAQLLEHQDAAILLWDFMTVYASYISDFPACACWGEGYAARPK